MSEEDKKEVEETTEEETLEENEDEIVEEVDDEVIETENEEVDEIDYKAKFEEAEKTIRRRNKKIVKLKEQKKENVEEEEEEDETKVDVVLKSLREDTIEDAIDAVTSNPDEAKLIRFHFDNSLNLTGYSKKEIIANIGYAKAIANQGKALTKANIISKKAKSDKTAGSPEFAGSPQNKKTVKVTAYDRKQADKYFAGDIKKWMKFK